MLVAVALPEETRWRKNTMVRFEKDHPLNNKRPYHNSAGRPFDFVFLNGESYSGKRFRKPLLFGTVVWRTSGKLTKL